jgi:hypothetical protein
MMLTLLFFAQVLVPGQSLAATCQGQFVQVVTSLTTIEAACVEVSTPPPPRGAIVIGPAEVSLYSQLPAPPPLRVLAVNRSVGSNIRDGIACLAVDTASSPNHCRRWSWSNGTYPSPPQTWTARPLPAWEYYGSPGTGITPGLPCAGSLTASVLACAPGYDVVALMPSYLEAGTYQLSLADYVALVEALGGQGVYLTASLPGGDDPTTAEHDLARLQAFNNGVRAAAQATGRPLLDIAAILSTHPDGTPYRVDGYEAISPYYTSEYPGGHLGYPSAGKIKAAMAWHVLLAQMAGWRP